MTSSGRYSEVLSTIIWCHELDFFGAISDEDECCWHCMGCFDCLVNSTVMRTCMVRSV